jgi:hypothetical protein
MTGIDEIADLLFLFENSGPVLIDDDLSEEPVDPQFIDVRLRQSYPNPFYGRPGAREMAASTIAIPFSLPRRARLTIEIFDLRGRRVAVLADGEFAEGEHEVRFDPSRFRAGAYLYRLKSDLQIFTRRIVIRK